MRAFLKPGDTKRYNIEFKMSSVVYPTRSKDEVISPLVSLCLGSLFSGACVSECNEVPAGAEEYLEISTAK